MTPDAFIASWRGERSEMRAEVAERLRISRRSREFLVVAGLPIDVGCHGVGFDIGGTELRRLKQKSSLVQLSRTGPGLVAICVDEANDGTVVQFEPDYYPNAPLRFLNSSVEQHAEFWLIFRKVMEATATDDDATVAELLRRLFQEADPEALADREWPWPRLIEDVAHGM